MPSTVCASRSQGLWSLASMLPGTPERTLLYGLDRRSVPGLASTHVRPKELAYDAAIAVSPRPPDPTWLREFGASLRPGGRLLLAVRSGWSRTHGGPRFGTSAGRMAWLLRQAGYTVERMYGVRPSLVLPEFVVCLTPRVSADFWSNLFRPWSRSGAIASAIAARVPALGVRSFPWLVVRARRQAMESEGTR